MSHAGEKAAILYQVPDHSFQLAFITGSKSGAGQGSLEIRGGKNQHFPCAINAIEIIAVPGLGHFGPALEIAQFLLRFLVKRL